MRRLPLSPPAGAAPFSLFSSVSSNARAPVLDSGELPFPHLGDWMQDGQPASHSHDAIACRVAVSQRRAAPNPHCDISVDGQSVVQQDAPYNLQCKMPGSPI